jgi:hypothetical protein
MTTGKQLNRKWNVGAEHALYRESGDWYHCLDKFPGALFDRYGYVLFKTQREFLSSRYLHIGERVHVPGGISQIPGYVRTG